MHTQDLSRLAKSAFQALHARLGMFDPGSRKRGVGYYHDGAVGELVFHAGAVQATVHGSQEYDVSWSYTRAGWRPDCDCPVGPNCKHSYALALELLDIADVNDAIDADDLALLLSRADAADTSSVAYFATPARPARAAAAERDLGPVSPRTALDSLRSSDNPLTRFRALMALLPEHALRTTGFDHERLHRALATEDADERCWELASLLAQHGVPGVPAALSAYLQREDAARRVAARRATVLTAKLADWASRRTNHFERSLRLVLSLAPGRRTGMLIEIEPRVTTARHADQPRSLEQLRQYRHGLRNAGSALPEDQLELLNALVRAHEQEQSMRYSFQEPLVRISPLAQFLLHTLPSPHVRWSDALPADLAERGGITPGEPVRYRATTASLIPDLAADSEGGLGLSLAVRWPDGSQRDARDAIFVCSRTQAMNESLYALIMDGALSPLRSSLPDDLLEDLLEAHSLPVSRPAAAALLPLLSTALPEAREAYQSHVTTHPVRTVVGLDLDDDDRLDFRLFALTPGLTWPARSPLPAGEHIFELGHHGQWYELADGAPEPGVDAAPHEHGGTLLHLPDPDCVRAGVEWLESTGVQPAPAPPHGIRRTVKLTARTVPRLAEAWARRPASVSWVGTRAAQALFAPGAVIRARVSAKRHGVDLLKISASWESELLSLGEGDLDRLRDADSEWVKLSGGWVRRELQEQLDDTLGVLADLGVEPGAGEQPLSVWQLAQAGPENLAALEKLGLDDESLKAVRALRQRVERFKGLPRVAVPRAFKGELRAYQRQGLDFLAWTSGMGLGAVLADDMGLGKTVQALAWLLHMRAREPNAGPSLVICPASVVHNWQREAQAFAPGLRVQTLGSGPERAQQLAQLDQADLLITNYALLRQDAEHWRAQRLFAVIADEAQMIKNPAAATSQLVCELTSAHRLALTGTPLENRALDLWSIMRFVNPGYLGSQRAFVERFDRADAPAHARRLLSAKLRPMLLRRLKREVAPELPERVEERRDCEMSPGQRRFYLAELARARSEVAALSAAGGLKKHKI